MNADTAAPVRTIVFCEPPYVFWDRSMDGLRKGEETIPGMGMLSFEAVLGRDHNLIMGIATISAFLTLISLLISDLLYVFVDPRISFEGR